MEKKNVSQVQMKCDTHTLLERKVFARTEGALTFPASPGSDAAIARGENFSHFTHSLTLHFINKAPGRNSHIFTTLQLEDRLEI